MTAMRPSRMTYYTGHAVNLIIWPPETKLLISMVLGFVVGIIGGYL